MSAQTFEFLFVLEEDHTRVSWTLQEYEQTDRVGPERGWLKLRKVGLTVSPERLEKMERLMTSAALAWGATLRRDQLKVGTRSYGHCFELQGGLSMSLDNDEYRRGAFTFLEEPPFEARYGLRKDQSDALIPSRFSGWDTCPARRPPGQGDSGGDCQSVNWVWLCPECGEGIPWEQERHECWRCGGAVEKRYASFQRWGAAGPVVKLTSESPDGSPPAPPH